MKPILALALFLVAIHAAALPKQSLQLKMYKSSQKAVQPRPRTYGTFNKRHVLAQGNATLGDFADYFYVVNVTLGTPAQTISLVVDTTESGLTIYPCDRKVSTNCYNSNLSSTYVFKGFNDTNLFNDTFGQDVFTKKNLNLCFLAIKNNENGFGPAWVLGEPFMRSYCNIFDVGNKQIGFAKYSVF